MKYAYQSGHCGIGRHGACLGSYAGEDCHCKCHDAEAVLTP